MNVSAPSSARLTDAWPSGEPWTTRCLRVTDSPVSVMKLEASLPMEDSPGGMGWRFPSISKNDITAGFPRTPRVNVTS